MPESTTLHEDMPMTDESQAPGAHEAPPSNPSGPAAAPRTAPAQGCLLYTSDAADEN